MFFKAALAITTLSLVLANPIIEYGPATGPAPPGPPGPPAAPAPAPAPPPITISQCNTGSAQCCNSVSTTSDPSTASLLGPIGVVLQGLGIPIGLGCTPISVIGIDSGASCTQAPVCCQQTAPNKGSLIGINCSPISL